MKLYIYIYCSPPGELPAAPRASIPGPTLSIWFPSHQAAASRRTGDTGVTAPTAYSINKGFWCAMRKPWLHNREN